MNTTKTSEYRKLSVPTTKYERLKAKRVEKAEKRARNTINITPQSIFKPNNEKLTQRTNPNARTDAFELLSDSTMIAKWLEKTTPCRNMINDGKCERDVCSFAHSMEELNDRMCFFDGNCRIPTTCPHKHSRESREDYYTRCNIEPPIFPTTGSIPNPKTPPSSPRPRSNTPPPAPRKPPRYFSQKLDANETIIKVPRKMAADAMKIALENGITNMHIAIID